MTNKSTLASLLMLMVVLWPAKAESDTKEAKSYVYGRIFSEFNTTLEGPEDQTAFEVKRAYLGYFKELEKGFAAEVKLDIGSPNDVSSYSLLRRFGYFKTAALYYTHEKLKLELGLIETTQFKVAESFWGKRYIFKSFMDEYKFGPSADIGIKAVYKWDKFTIDGSIFNGEGYSSLQNDNTFKAAVGITARPFKGFTARLYTDFASKNINQSTYSVFAGQKIGRFSLGGEYNFLVNYDFNENRDRYGYSVFGGIVINEQWNVFGRFDKLQSNIPAQAEIPWALSSDGSAIISGIEFKATKSVIFALNYQDWYPAAQNSANESSLHVNIDVKF